MKSEYLASDFFTFYPLVAGPVHSCAISAPRTAYTTAVISAHWIYRTHWHHCPTRYSFTPERINCFTQDTNSETISQGTGFKLQLCQIFFTVLVHIRYSNCKKPGVCDIGYGTVCYKQSFMSFAKEAYFWHLVSRYCQKYTRPREATFPHQPCWSVFFYFTYFLVSMSRHKHECNILILHMIYFALFPSHRFKGIYAKMQLVIFK